MKYKVWDKVKINKSELINNVWDDLLDEFYKEWIFKIVRISTFWMPYTLENDNNYYEEELIPFLTYDL